LSFGLVPLLLAPLDHGSILHRGINNVIGSTGTVGVAESLGVPGQTHWHGRINFGHGKRAKGAISNLLAQRGGLDRGGLVGTKESIVEMSVVQSHVVGFGFGIIRTTEGRATTSASAERRAAREGRYIGGRHTIILEGTRIKT
jgi:hypothetical protein